MKRLIYQVYVGNTNKLYDWCVKSVSNYCKKFDITHIVQREPILKILPDPTRQERNVGNWTKLGYLPIFEKENAFDLLKSSKAWAGSNALAFSPTALMSTEIISSFCEIELTISIPLITCPKTVCLLSNQGVSTVSYTHLTLPTICSV